MQQFIKYFMNMRLLARRAEYARGPLLARMFCAFLRAETAGFPGRSKAAGMRNSFGHYHAETICKANCSGPGLWKTGKRKGRAFGQFTVHKASQLFQNPLVCALLEKR